MCKVLIVEDDLLIALDEEMALEDAGHTVVGTATTAGEAVKIAAQHDLDVMVVDLRLADGSRGPDAVDLIREDQAVEVVFVSGNLDPTVRAELERFEPLAMISKPFIPSKMIDALAPVAS